MEEVLEYARKELDKYSQSVFGESTDIAFGLENVSEWDDGYTIDVENGRGKITGRNGRSILMGVYDLFYELGCRWVRPSAGGDYLVRRKLSDCNVRKTFTPKYRHRGICSEGAISEENLTDMVEWLPKMQMNAFFLQFSDGHAFFEKWYKHEKSSVLEAETYSEKDSASHYANVVKEIKKRGLCFHAVGHGWTMEALHYVPYGENATKDEAIRPQDRELFAMINGKRGLYQSTGDTQLCYGNPKTRTLITDCIAEYLERHAEIDVLHFWLADNINNHCECDLCKDTLPSDFYVQMLNELDEKLTAKHIQTKIVFLIYCDLLFAPQRVTVRNPERFIMMYAPIARNYFDGLYKDGFTETNAVHREYVRNHNAHPHTNAEYLKALEDWQQVVSCDSFSYEYHLMTFLYGGDLSSLKISETIYRDMCDLQKVGLNGNVSCQLQRISLPTFLQNYVMAKGLAGSTSSFDEIVAEYTAAAYGKQSDEVWALLKETEQFFCSDIVRNPENTEEKANYILAFSKYLQTYVQEHVFSDENEEIYLSLRLIAYFIEILLGFLKVYHNKTTGKPYETDKKAFYHWLDLHETEYQKYLDVLFLKDCLEGFIA